MTPQAHFSMHKVDGVKVIDVEGEIDIANVDELRLFLEKAVDGAGPGMAINLTKATYFDSRTIALLLDIGTKARVHRQRIAVVAPAKGFAAKILEIAGLPQVVPSFPEVAEAVDAVNQPASA